MLWPPYMRRPTTRLANVTGMRRWPCSMNTMATSSDERQDDDDAELEVAGLGPDRRRRPSGMVDTTLVKIRIDMPWPMPRWVISSPSHMTTAVPAVMVSTISSTRGTVKWGIRSMLRPVPPPSRAAAAVVEDVGQAGRLQQGQGDGQVAGDLGQLLLADRPLVPPLLELGDHHHQQLDDDRAVMYGMIPSPNTANWVSAPPENRLRKPSTPPLDADAVELLDGAEVDARAGDVGAEPVDRR